MRRGEGKRQGLFEEACLGTATAGWGRVEGAALGWVRMSGWFSGLAAEPGALLLRRGVGLPPGSVQAWAGQTWPDKGTGAGSLDLYFISQSLRCRRDQFSHNRRNGRCLGHWHMHPLLRAHRARISTSVSRRVTRHCKPHKREK